MSMLASAFARENFNSATNSMKPYFLRFWLYKFLCELAEMITSPLKTQACSLPTLNYVHLRELRDPSEDPLC